MSPESLYSDIECFHSSTLCVCSSDRWLIWFDCVLHIDVSCLCRDSPARSIFKRMLSISFIVPHEWMDACLCSFVHRNFCFYLSLLFSMLSLDAWNAARPSWAKSTHHLWRRSWISCWIRGNWRALIYWSFNCSTLNEKNMVFSASLVFLPAHNQE